jgi:glycosyltransferase involved in cell wall biosynthesis
MLNAQDTIGHQLAALARQTYSGAWEVLVVDNGCRDRSVEIASAWSERLPALRVVPAHGRRSLNHARNVGAWEARGDYLAFCDADDVVMPGWLEALVAAAPGADIMGGPLDIEALNPPLYRAWRPDVPSTQLELRHGFLPQVCGGNCGIWTEVARDIGWDEAFYYGSSETEFCWRAQLASYSLAFVPDAVVQLRYRRRVSQLMGQFYGYGRSGPYLYRRFRSLGMKRDMREALWWWRWLIKHSPNLLKSSTKRGNWLRIAAFRCGRVKGSLTARVLYL